MAYQLKRMERILSIFAALVIIGGGLSGLVVWFWPLEADPTASSASTSQAGTTQPSQPSRTVAYQENLQNVAEKSLPKGWEAEVETRIVKVTDKRFALKPEKPGPATIKILGLTIRDDFVLECEFQLVTGQPVEVTLNGKDGGASLPILVDGGSSTDLHFPGGLMRNLYGATSSVPSTLRLEREGVIYRVILNGKVAHARRLHEFQDFDGLKIVLHGMDCQIFAVRVTPQASSPSPPLQHDPVEAFRRGFREDFKTTKVGDVPPGWTGVDSVGARQDGRPRLEGGQQDRQEIKTPPLRIVGDFVLECECEVATGQPLEVALVGREGEASLPILVDGGNSTDVHFTGGAFRNLPVITPGKASTLRVEREGTTYRVSLDGVMAHARRLPQFKDFEGLRFTLTGPGQTRLFAVRIGPLPDQHRVPSLPWPNPAEAFKRGFKEDFKNAIVGGLPAYWEGEDGVGVRTDGRPRLEAGEVAKQLVQTPPIGISGDFFAEFECQLNTGQPLEVVLLGAGGAVDVTVKVDPGSSTDVYLEEAVKNVAIVTGATPAKLRIQRKGTDWAVLLNGQKVHTKALADAKDFAGIKFGLVGGQWSSKLFSVRCGPLE